MIVARSKELSKLLKSNSEFKNNFERLLKSFSDRIWTKEVCFYFKVLCEQLFLNNDIPVIVHVRNNMNNIDGSGRFEIEFLPQEVIEAVKGEKND